MITSYGYGTLRLKEGPNQPGSILSTLYIYFIQFFLLISYSLRDPNYICPEFFYFRDPFSRLPFATPLRDSHSRLIFTTHISRLTFATHVRGSHSRLHSRLTLVTRIRDSTRDSRSRLPIAPPTATRYFLSRLPSCDSTTDGRTVLTPQRHLPSFPTLTLNKKIWNLLPCLASTSSYYPPSCPPPLVALCPLRHPLAHYLLQRPLPPPPCQDLCQHPHLYQPLCPYLHPSCLGTCHCSFNETTFNYCRGTKLEILGHLSLPYISGRLPNVRIGHSPI